MMIRMLTRTELPQMMQLAQDLARFPKPLLERMHRAMLFRMDHDPKSFILGQFDDTNTLVGWAHFKEWDEGDGQAYTWGATQCRVSRVDILNAACTLFERRGKFTCYALKPVDGTVSMVGRVGSLYENYKWEVIETVKAGQTSAFPVINKYVLTTPMPSDYEVGRMTKAH